MAAFSYRRLPKWSQVGFCIVVWWTCAVGVTLMVKSILGVSSATGHEKALFPYPFTLTALANGCTGGLAISIGLLRKICVRCGTTADQEGKIYSPFRWGDALQLFLTGFLQGLEIGCFNKALEYLTVAKRTMIMSTSLLFIMGIAVPAGLEQLSCGKVVASLLLTMGGCLQGLSSWRHFSSANEDMLSIQGYVMAIFGMLLSSFRWALLQHVLQRTGPDSYLKQMSKFQMLSYIMPVTMVVCLLMAAIFEQAAFARVTLNVMRGVMTLSALLVVMVASELAFVQLTSAVAMNVAGQLHNIPIVLGGVFFFDEKVHPFAAMGFGVCLLGALLYTSESRRAHSTDGREKNGAEKVAQEDVEVEDFLSPGRRGNKHPARPSRAEQHADERVAAGTGVATGGCNGHPCKDVASTSGGDSETAPKTEPTPNVYGAPSSPASATELPACV